jgi:uncharacterized protein (DUF2336 family)
MELNKEDIARLLADPSPHTRADVAAKIGVQLAEQELSETELKLSEDIVRHLARDIAVQVRASLAQSVKKAKKLPHDVALRLAQDVEEVSLPVLEFSSVLSDKDLVAIIQAAPPEKQEAIARREQVSESVSEALVDKGSEKTVHTLLGNKSAQIGATTFDKVVTKFNASEKIQGAVVQREHLPLAVAEKLVAHVSEALREQLIARHELPRDVLADVVMQGREQATVNLLGTARGHDIEKLVSQMKENDRLTPSLIIRALCMGDVAFFEASMAVLAGVPILNARVLTHDKGRLGLKSLYDKTGLPPGMYPIIRVALEVVQETPFDGGAKDRERYRVKVIERILTQYEDFNPEDLNYLLDKLSDLVDKAA